MSASFVDLRLGKVRLIASAEVADALRSPLEGGGLDALLARARASRDPYLVGRVSEMEAGGVEYILKREDPGALGRSRLLREMRRAAALATAGVACVVPAAWARQGRRACLLLPRIGDATSGLHLIKEGVWRALEPAARRAALKAAAEAIASLHDAGYAHRDLNPSNLLFEGAGGEDVRVLLLDVGGARRGGRGARASDLARLWRSAREAASRTDALRFLKAYLAALRGAGPLRTLLARIDAAFERMRPHRSRDRSR